MTEFCALRAKTYSFLIDGYDDDDYEKNKIINKKTKGTKKFVVKTEIKSNNYVDSLFNDKVLNKSQHRFKSDHHNVHTEKINKIALSNNDDKRIQTTDKITTYPYGMKLDDNETDQIIISSQKLREESEKSRKESSQIIISSQKLREELKSVRKESVQIVARSQKLREESKSSREKSRNETDQIIARSQKLREESEKCRKESSEIINRSQRLREESKRLRKESAQIIARSQKLRAE